MTKKPKAEQELLLRQVYEAGAGVKDDTDDSSSQQTTQTSTTTVTASSTTLTVPSDLQYTTDREWDVLRYTNIERAKEGLPLLVTFDDMQEYGGTRGMEIAYTYNSDHTRPDGRACFTVFSDDGFSYWHNSHYIFTI